MLTTGLWTQRGLYTYIPGGAPEIVFYYKPLAGPGLQEERRDLYKKFMTTYDYMVEVFTDRMFMFGVNGGPPSQQFLWPEDVGHQEALLMNIPRHVVIEGGARMLGWTRDAGEAPKEFIDRIARDLAAA